MNIYKMQVFSKKSLKNKKMGKLIYRIQCDMIGTNRTKQGDNNGKKYCKRNF